MVAVVRETAGYWIEGLTHTWLSYVGETVQLLWPCTQPEQPNFQNENYCNTTELPAGQPPSKPLAVASPNHVSLQNHLLALTVNREQDQGRACFQPDLPSACRLSPQDCRDHQHAQRHSSNIEPPPLLLRNETHKRPSALRKVATSVASFVFWLCTCGMRPEWAHDDTRVASEYSSAKVVNDMKPSSTAKV